ncbi:hypothetical protein EC991_000879 [Linnemannia zychae]|nr:hypothetical protein EC991_000879 [Linnemannia zychae]
MMPRFLRMVALVLPITAILQLSTAVADYRLADLDLEDPYSLPVSSEAAHSKPTAILLKGGTIIAYDDKKKDLDIIRGGDILIVNDRIQQIGKSITKFPSGTEVVNVTGSIISPGFVNTHRHSWQHVLQTLAPDLDGLGDYLYKWSSLGKWTPNFTAEDIYRSTRMAMAAAVDGGVTTVLDHAHALLSPGHATGMLKAHIESGARVWYAHSPMPTVRKDKYDFDWTAMDTKHGWQWKQLRELAEKGPWADGRVQLALAWEYGRNTEEAKFGFHLAKELNLTAMTMHDCGWPLQPTGYKAKPIYQLNEWNLLNSSFPIVFSHGNIIDGADLALLRETNQFASITPESEHHFSLSQLFTPRFMGQGSLGTDTAFTYSSDMVSQMRLQLQSTRKTLANPVHYNSRYTNNTAMTVNQVFLLATRNGGLALRRPDLGVIKVGAKADLVVYSSNNPQFSVFYDPVAAVVLHSSIRDIQHVMVDGRWIKKNYELVGLNWPKLQGDLEKSARKLQDIINDFSKDWGKIRAEFFKMSGYTEDMFQNIERVSVEPSVL